MASIEVRPVEDEAGMRRSLELWNAVYWTMPVSFADLRDYQDYCSDSLDLLALVDGEPVGSGFAGVEPEAAEPSIVKTHIAVLKPSRRRGVGTALYGALSGWARERGKTTLEAWILDVEPEGADFAAKRGFTEIMRELRVALDLAGLGAPVVEPPDGIEIVTWAERSNLSNGIYEVHVEAAPDIPGNDEVVAGYEEWLEHHMSGPSDRPEATFVALAGDEVVGYAKLHLSEARPGVAVHDMTGVKRAWRGRGVARALKATQIAWAIRAGYERLETSNELRNAPIRTLNDAFGYRPAPGQALVRGPLARGR